jgi:hypothetical protein
MPPAPAGVRYPLPFAGHVLVAIDLPSGAFDVASAEFQFRAGSRDSRSRIQMMPESHQMLAPDSSAAVVTACRPQR